MIRKEIRLVCPVFDDPERIHSLKYGAQELKWHKCRGSRRCILYSGKKFFCGMPVTAILRGLNLLPAKVSAPRLKPVMIFDPVRRRLMIRNPYDFSFVQIIGREFHIETRYIKSIEVRYVPKVINGLSELYVHGRNTAWWSGLYLVSDVDGKERERLVLVAMGNLYGIAETLAGYLGVKVHTAGKRLL